MRNACLPMRKACMAIALTLLLMVPGLAAAPETIELTSGDLKLKGTLYKPEGPGPFPGIVAMHGCEGLLNSSGTLSSRYQEWADWLVKAGFTVLYVDSYGARGHGNECRTRTTVRSDRERLADASAARAWLQTQSFAKPEHISLLGWSSGAVSVLWAVRPRVKPHDDKPDFRSAVAYYPGCRRLEATAWSARIPTLIMIGGADDVVSARSCEQMVAGARGRSARATIIVYPGAYHDFDHPNRAVQPRTGYAFSVDGSGRIHTGTNPAARADSRKHVLQWLER
ncbi:MAG: dienelactone hydrolase family protein [Xanthobacteraceae bacterium]